MRGSAFLLAIVGLVAFAGCTRTLDTADVEPTFAQALEEQTGAAIGSVDCPDDIEAEAGARFQCEATADDGSTITVDVTQKDDEGNVELNVRFVRIADLEAGIEAQFGVSDVDCPDLVRLEAGARLECSGTGENEAPVAIGVTINDAEGTDVDVEIEPES